MSIIRVKNTPAAKLKQAFTNTVNKHCESCQMKITLSTDDVKITRRTKLLTLEEIDSRHPV